MSNLHFSSCISPITRTVLLIIVAMYFSQPLLCKGAPAEIEKVFTDGVLGNFFTGEAGYPGDDEFFGIYPMHVKGGQLYLGKL